MPSRPDAPAEPVRGESVPVGSGVGWSEVEGGDVAPAAEHPFATADGQRYRLGGTLGVGGMGHVRVAFDRRLRREVALKEVRQEVRGDVARRLAREAWITAHLEHPGIVPVYDAGRTEEGRLFYTMRLVRGRSLEAALAEATGPVARRALLRSFLGVCETVAYAHANGVIHRDLKPANVMVGPFGEVQVVDWGLARGVDEAEDAALPWSGDPGLTVVGSAVGTPGYMSPEQARGERATPRSDVWSLGAVLVEILAGEPPYGRGDSAGERARKDAPIDLRGIEGPPDLLAVAARALATDPRERYPDAAALARDVEAWVDGRRVDAYRYSPRELAVQFLRVWRLPLAVLAAATVALAVGAGVAFDRIRDERDRARAAEEATERALGEASDALARELADRARAAAHRGERADAERLAVRALEVAASPVARGVLAGFAAVAPPIRGEPVPLPACRARVWSDGDAFLCLEASATSLWTPGADAPRWRVPLVATDGAHVGPLGRVVLVVDRRFRVLDAADGRVLHAPDFETPNAVGILSPSTDRHVGLLTLRLAALDAATGEVTERDPCEGGEPARIGAMDASGRTAILCGLAEARIGPVDGPAVSTWRLDVADALRGPNAVAFLGDRLLLGLGDGRVVPVDAATGVPDGPSGDAGTSVRGLVTGDGPLVAVTGERGGVGVWNARTGAWEERLPASAGRAVDVRGRTVRTAGEALVAWTFPEGRGVREVRVPAGLTAAVPSPDGRALGVAGGGVLAIYDVARGERLAGAEIPFVVKHAAFGPDGRLFGAISGLPGLAAVSPGGAADLDPPATTCRRVAWLGDSLLVLPYNGGPDWWDSTLAAPRRDLDVGVFHDLDADGSRAVLASADAVWWLDGPDTAPRRLFGVIDPVAVALAGDEIVVATSRRVAVHASDGTLVLAWDHPGDLVADVAVSPDGRRVATADLDGLVRVFDRATGALLARAEAHTQRAVFVGFEPGGVLVSAGWDGRVVRHGLDVLERAVPDLRAAVDAAWGPEPDPAPDRADPR